MLQELDAGAIFDVANAVHLVQGELVEDSSKDVDGLHSGCKLHLPAEGEVGIVVLAFVVAARVAAIVAAIAAGIAAAVVAAHMTCWLTDHLAISWKKILNRICFE